MGCLVENGEVNRRIQSAKARLPGAVVVVAASVVILMGFTTWMTVTLAGGSPATLTGWGTIGGRGSAAGENINDVISSLQGSGNYRPALLATALAALAAPAGLRLLFVRGKIAAVSAGTCGLFIAAWGLYRALVPGDVAGIVTDGDSTQAGFAPWLVLAAGTAMMAAAATVFVVHPEPVPARRTRGIQQRR